MSCIINKTLLFENLKRFWPIAVIPLLIYGIGVYASVLGEVTSHTLFMTIEHVVGIINMRNFNMMFTVVLTPVAAAFFTFGIFFNKTAATTIYAMPFNKRQLFITNALSGIILSLVPVLIFCIVLLIPMSFHDDWQQIHNEQMQAAIDFGHMEEGETRPFMPQEWLADVLVPNGPTEGAPLNSFPIIAGLFLRLALVTIFYFGVAWLAFSLAGNGFVGLLLAGAIPILPMAVVGLTDIIGVLYVFGYPNTQLMGFQRFFVAYHNPAMWTMLLGSGGFTRMNAIVLPFIFNIVIGAGIFAAAYFVSRARKTERTGNSVMFNPVKNVCVFLFAFCGMVISGVIFYAVTESLLMFRVGFVVGFIIGYIVAQMIAEKTFQVMHKMRFLPHFLGTAVTLYVLVFIFTQWGMGFYTRRVPTQDNIYGVHVSYNWWNHSRDLMREIANTCPDAIAETRRVHQVIVDNASELRIAPDFHRSAHEFDGTQWRQIGETLSIAYVLQNGRVITRRYVIPFDFMERTGIYEFIYGESVVLAEFPALRHPEAVASLSGWANVREWDAETERFEHARSEMFVVYEREQIDWILQFAGDIAVESAIMRFNTFHRTVVEDFAPQETFYHGQESIHIQLDSRFEFVDDLTMSGTWTLPTIYGERAEMVLERAHEWDAVVRVDVRVAQN